MSEDHLNTPGSKINLKHRVSNLRAYSSWRGMTRRCFNKSHKSYKYYGGRGITICEEWRDFPSFFADMGERPKGMSIDRIDNNGGYSKENCRWATQKQQCNNTRVNHLITYENETLTIAEWAEKIGISHDVFRQRLIRWKFDMKRVIEQPVHARNSRTEKFIYNSEAKTAKEWAYQFNINLKTMYNRLKSWNNDIKRAIETPVNKKRYLKNLTKP